MFRCCSFGSGCAGLRNMLVRPATHPNRVGLSSTICGWRFFGKRARWLVPSIANRKSFHPPATILTISSRSPALSWRCENSDGATAWPLCSTTTLRGRSPCVTRNSSMVQGSLAGTSCPLAVRDDWVIERIFEQAGFRHRYRRNVCSTSFARSGSSRQRRIPILPHRFIAEAADEVGDLARRTFVRNVELFGCARAIAIPGRPLAGAQLDNSSALGSVQVLLARPGVPARLGVASSAHQRDAEWNQPVAQLGRLARREHEADIGKHQAERAYQLHQVAVAHARERLEFAGAGPEARQRNRQLRFPACAQQIIRVGRDTERLETPVCQTQQRTDAQPAKTGGISALGRFQTPVEIALR